MNATTPLNEQEIALLVDSFYAKVRVDPEIGPVFNDAVQNWNAHLALLKDFWSAVLLTTGRYKGDPLLAHFRLPIEERYFARWLTLFRETAYEVMSAPHAEVVAQRANLIAVNMKRVLLSQSNAQHDRTLLPTGPKLSEKTPTNREEYMTTEGFADDGTMLKNFAQLDLTQEVLTSEQTKPWQKGHTARILFKKADFRIVLISLEKGSVIKEHHADGTISIQVLKGSIRFTSQGETHTLQVHGLAALGASIKHEVEALEESAFLLTIAWPNAEKLQTMTHRESGT